MSRFDRYVLAQMMAYFGFFALLLVSVYWVNSAVRLFDRLISDNQSVWVFLELSALSLPNVVRQMVPVATFVAAIYATNRLASESELVVMQATGFSPFRLARPVLAFGLIVALLQSVLLHVLVPASRTRLMERNTEISQNITSKFLTEGVFLYPADGVTMFISKISENGELGGLFLSDRSQPGSETIYTAERAYLARSDNGPKLVMLDGSAQTRAGTDGRLTFTAFQDFTYDVGRLIAGRGPYVPGIEERATPALLRPSEAMLAETGASRDAAIYEGHDRFGKALICVSLALVGFAALQGGSFSRFGKWRQIGLASVIFILLFLVMNLADKTGARDARLFWLAYLPAAAGALVAWVLLVLATHRRRVPHQPPAGGAPA